MKKHHSAPPFLILMDVLFIFLFSSLLDKPPKLEYRLPDRPFPCGEVVFFERNGVHSWYHRAGKTWLSTEDLVETYNSKFYIDQDCSRGLCAGIVPPRADGHLKVVLIGELYRQIAELTALACQSDAVQCGNLVFTITLEGRVDRDKLLQDNPVYQAIPGIEHLTTTPVCHG